MWLTYKSLWNASEAFENSQKYFYDNPKLREYFLNKKESFVDSKYNSLG